MKNLLIAGTTVTAALFFSACGGSNDTPPVVTPDTQSVVLASAQRDVKYLISEDNDLSLYEFDKDTTAGVSNCSSDDAADGVTDGQSCIDRWPIYETAVSDDFGIATPHDVQSTYKGHPLYYWFNDVAKGDILGDKVANVWHLIYPNSDFDPTSVGTNLSDDVRTQTYLTSHDARALYTFDNDEVNVSNCYDQCAVTWPIFDEDVDTTNLPVGMDATAFGKISRSDGKTQTTYKGQPLYYFVNDTNTGDTNGDWVKGVWHLIELGSVAKTTELVADVAAGQTLFNNCASCHGTNGDVSALGESILLSSGIDTAEQAETLINYMKNDGTGKNATMVNIAKGLSDQQIKDVSAYIATLN